MKQYFIVGTDTDCGKTYVTCQLIRYFQSQGHKSLAIKPVASGCFEDDDGRLISEDAQQLMLANGEFEGDICPWRFKPAIAPHIAAEAVGIRLSAQAITDFCRDERFSSLDYLLIEGAGGLMVPLNEQETWLDFLTISQIPVILVVGMRLGCINHALLTISALTAHNIVCEGWIANCIDKDMQSLSLNIKTIADKADLPLLATVPYGSSLDILSQPFLSI